jgi:hypothetical protein
MDGIFPHCRRDSDGWPDAWACGDDSPSRRDASELEALWWRGLVICVGVGSREVGCDVCLSKFSGALQKILG